MRIPLQYVANYCLIQFPSRYNLQFEHSFFSPMVYAIKKPESCVRTIGIAPGPHGHRDSLTQEGQTKKARNKSGPSALWFLRNYEFIPESGESQLSEWMIFSQDDFMSGKAGEWEGYLSRH